MLTHFVWSIHVCKWLSGLTSDRARLVEANSLSNQPFSASPTMLPGEMTSPASRAHIRPSVHGRHGRSAITSGDITFTWQHCKSHGVGVVGSWFWQFWFVSPLSCRFPSSRMERNKRSRSSGKHCAVFGCTNNSRKRNLERTSTANGVELKFHRFPVDKDEKRKWLSAVNRANFTPTTNSRVS